MKFCSLKRTIQILRTTESGPMLLSMLSSEFLKKMNRFDVKGSGSDKAISAVLGHFRS